MQISLSLHAPSQFLSRPTQVHRAFGEIFASIGVREPLPNASEAFTKFGETHREMEKFAIRMLKKVKPMVSDMGTFLHKAVPDTRLTIKKYADCKFEYLSYCLKVCGTRIEGGVA